MAQSAEDRPRATSSGRRVDRALVAFEALVALSVVAAIAGRGRDPASVIFFVLAAAATATTGWFIARMFLSLSDPALDVVGRVEDHERAQLEAEKTILLQGIKEFEADAGTGKVDDADYAHLRKTAEARALEIIRRIKSVDELYTERARELVEKRVGKGAAQTSSPRAKSGRVLPDIKEGVPYASAKRFIDAPARLRIANEQGTCGACDAANPIDGHFCSSCGRPLLPEAA
ncbi:MAG: hypothetical protein HYV07_19615 [Deltaproteobacteria bacterium]|nr:hypothetical protein [Deltaproteobacteria bacterium]